MDVQAAPVLAKTIQGDDAGKSARELDRAM